jgi:hypothetical protein
MTAIATPSAGRTILILAGHPDASTTAQLLEQTHGYQHALVVAPTIPPAGARWIIDDDEAEREARARAETVAEVLRAGGLDTRTEIGDADPQLALADALAQHPVDGTVVLGAKPAPRHRGLGPLRHSVTPG